MRVNHGMFHLFVHLCVFVYSYTLVGVFMCFQLRRQARLRREYIYRKSVEDKERSIQEKKDRIKHALESKHCACFTSVSVQQNLISFGI